MWLDRQCELGRISAWPLRRWSGRVRRFRTRHLSIRRIGRRSGRSRSGMVTKSRFLPCGMLILYRGARSGIAICRRIGFRVVRHNLRRSSEAARAHYGRRQAEHFSHVMSSARLLPHRQRCALRRVSLRGALLRDFDYWPGTPGDPAAEDGASRRGRNLCFHEKLWQNGTVGAGNFLAGSFSPS
jgi:hypothetical protein